jgi:hypothetical protein
MSISIFIRVPLEDVETPKAGWVVIKDHWWVVEDGCVLGFKLYGEKSKERPSPLCNTDARIVEMLIRKKPTQEAVFLPVAYWWPHKCDC